MADDGRNYKKPVTDEPFTASGMVLVTPNATTERYPADPQVDIYNDPDVHGAVDTWIVRNRSTAAIRVAVDSIADATHGHIVDPKEDFRIPERTERFITVYGGNGTAIRLHWFRW